MPMQHRQDDQEDISKLMRLKRFEQPSPEYFENFLQDFQARQRSQLLREPAWRIAWDRFCAFFGEQAPARIGYGFASTAVLVAAAITSFNIIESRPTVEAPDMAEVSTPAPRQVIASADPASLNLNSRIQMPDLPSLAHTASITTPRYVMDARPVSYEPPSSF